MLPKARILRSIWGRRTGFFVGGAALATKLVVMIYYRIQAVLPARRMGAHGGLMSSTCSFLSGARRSGPRMRKWGLAPTRDVPICTNKLRGSTLLRRLNLEFLGCASIWTMDEVTINRHSIYPCHALSSSLT